MPDMMPQRTEAELLDTAVRIVAACNQPATTVEQERAKADAILDRMCDARLLAAPVPAALGGNGLPVTAVARLVAAISAASGSAGLICAMHFAQVISLVRHGTGDVFADFLSRLADGQMLVASGTSEVGVGGDILKSRCATEPAGNGLMLVKECANISYLDRAGAILVTAMHDGRPRPMQRLILVEAAQLAFRASRENQMMGMRGIMNRAVTIEARFAPTAILPEPFGVIARTMSPASHIFWASVWSGLAGAALSRAEAAAPGSARVAAAADRRYAMNALIRDACIAFDGEADGPALRAGARANGLKITCAELLGEIVADCAAAAGLRGFVEGSALSLSEVIRDSYSARIMVSSDRLAGANAQVRRLAPERICRGGSGRVTRRPLKSRTQGRGHGRSSPAVHQRVPARGQDRGRFAEGGAVALGPGLQRRRAEGGGKRGGERQDAERGGEAAAHQKRN